MTENKIISRLSLVEIPALLGISFIIHALVLSFIFPGYYSPLWPSNADFYTAITLAQSSLGFIDYLSWPRPVGYVFFRTIGFLGLHGSILAVLSVVILNCCLTAALVRRAIGVDINLGYWIAFAIYVFLVFTHPYYYITSNWDLFAQISYTLLISSGWFFYLYSLTPRKTSLLILAITLSLLAFLAKETYGLSALLLAAFWFLVNRRSGALRAAIPAISIGLTLFIALLFEYLNRSTFTAGGKSSDDPYYVSLAPTSLLSEWGRYIHAGLNPLSILLILLIAFSAIKLLKGQWYKPWLAISLPIAGILAWIPNATLPNHFTPAYSWNGSYLLFVPILFFVTFWKISKKSRILAACIIAIALVSPLASLGAYKSNQWTLEQEKILRNLVNSFDSLAKSLPVNSSQKKVLITGLAFPATPFDRGLWMFPDVNNVEFVVVRYSPVSVAIPDYGYTTKSLRFISPVDADLSNFQFIWAFRSDGSLIKNESDLSTLASHANTELGFSRAKLLLFPDLVDIFGACQGNSCQKPDSNKYLQCGKALLNYGDLAGAEQCLTFSSSLNPTDPYPYFYLGDIKQRLGFFDQARSLYKKAIALDSKEYPYPWFKKVLENLDRLPQNKPEVP